MNTPRNQKDKKANPNYTNENVDAQLFYPKTYEFQQLLPFLL